MSNIVHFPKASRYVPLIADPRYRAGAAAFAAYILEQQRGYTREQAKTTAQTMVDEACKRALIEAGFAT